MAAPSGDKIAPVTYLFADAPEAKTPQPEGEHPSLTSGASPKAVRRAENVSLNGLTRRNMSRWEIEKLLRSRGIDDDIIAAEVARLEGVGLIDDAALAETLVRTQRERKGLGHQALIAELRRRHIDQDIIEAATAAEDGGEDAEQDRANELAAKRARTLGSYDSETAKRRLTGYLMRKGYSSSIVRSAVSGALDDRRSGVRFV